MASSYTLPLSFATAGAFRYMVHMSAEDLEPVRLRRTGRLEPVPLSPHPRSPSASVRTIVVRVRRVGTEGLHLAFEAVGAIAGVRLPPVTEPRIAPRLWEHTCFEAFVGLEGERRYHEVNFAPSGEWAVFEFDDYRDGALLPDETVAPRTSFRCGRERLELEAFLPVNRLAKAYGEKPLRVGLSAVVEESDGALSYWALRHPGAKPDFHHPDARALRLAAPGS